MSSSLKLSPRKFAARIAELGFTTVVPADWISHPLPTEDVDFSNPSLFVPLAVVTAPHAAIVFAFAARPAHDDGTIHDWAMYHLNHHQLQLRAIGRDKVAGVPAAVGESIQPSDLGPMVVRFAFLEDGDRLLNLTLTAPEMLADSVRDAWFAMLHAFRLENPRGSRFKLESHPDETPAAPIPEPWLEARPAAPAAVEFVVDSETGEPLLPTKVERRLPPNGQVKKGLFSDFALSDDSISLDEDHEINVKLRNRGAGLIPNIAGLSDQDRRATLAAGAIMAQFDVPYGWHVIDDGQRTLVFEPSGNVQICMNLVPRDGRSDETILDDLEASMRHDGHPEFLRRHEGRIHSLGVRRIANGSQALEQYHLLHPFRDDTMVLRAHVTAMPEYAASATALAEMILESCVFDVVAPAEEYESEPIPGPELEATRSSQPTPDGRPAWWHRALALEGENQLKAAEEIIRKSCPHLGYAHATADLYRLRMLRLKECGDDAGARAAFMKASDFIWSYAAMATSGGEGAALSQERDEFRAQLVREYGGDPEAAP